MRGGAGAVEKPGLIEEESPSTDGGDATRAPDRPSDPCPEPGIADARAEVGAPATIRVSTGPVAWAKLWSAMIESALDVGSRPVVEATTDRA
jgi:hypothetical protein